MAERARALADRLANPTLKARITRMAVGFDALAERVDRILAQRAANSDRLQQNGHKPSQRNRPR